LPSRQTANVRRWPPGAWQCATKSGHSTGPGGPKTDPAPPRACSLVAVAGPDPPSRNVTYSDSKVRQCVGARFFPLLPQDGPVHDGLNRQGFVREYEADLDIFGQAAHSLWIPCRQTQAPGRRERNKNSMTSVLQAANRAVCPVTVSEAESWPFRCSVRTYLRNHSQMKPDSRRQRPSGKWESASAPPVGKLGIGPFDLYNMYD
jgi:hypothetical protein